MVFDLYHTLAHFLVYPIGSLFSEWTRGRVASCLYIAKTGPGVKFQFLSIDSKLG